ncbi:hypothetical protein BDZ45DRAFT_292722 [Acephala macrosclerotiorum]|nr:hypothetical protein BDZ45DRAFT_292722 [Acephala macrosclerotiorum]
MFSGFLGGSHLHPMRFRDSARGPRTRWQLFSTPRHLPRDRPKLTEKALAYAFTAARHATTIGFVLFFFTNFELPPTDQNNNHYVSTSDLNSSSDVSDQQ